MTTAAQSSLSAQGRTRTLTHDARLKLEALEERALMSANPTLDLTTRGSSGWIGDAQFVQTDAQPTGTGNINSFVRVQANGVEQGYNTSARPLQYNENSSPQFTRSLKLSEVPQVTINGKVSLEFLLDVNQTAANPMLSLDDLRVYVGDNPAASGYDP